MIRTKLWVLFWALLLSSSIQAKEIKTSPFEIEREKAIEQAVLSLLSDQSVVPVVGAVKIEPTVSTVETLRVPLGSSVTLAGKEIVRVVTTNPDIVAIEPISPTTLKITGQALGETLLHVWDLGQRRSFKVQVVRKTEFEEVSPLIPEAKKGEKAKPFKLSYQLNHNAFYRGNSTSTMSRSTLNVTHQIKGEGETPYGDLSYRTSLRKRRTDLDVSNYTLQLRNGKIGGLRDFNLTLFDSGASAGKYILPTTEIRGVQWTQKLTPLDYDLFWGQERLGAFGSLAPGFEQSRKSYLSGLGLRKQYEEGVFKGSYVHGYGSDRSKQLKDDVAGFEFEHEKSPFRWSGELASNGSHYGINLANRWISPPWRLDTSYRDIEKDFLTIVGTPPEQGERGILLTLDYDPLADLHFSGNLDLYRDFLFPNRAEPDALNRRFQLEMSSRFWENYYFRTGYSDSRLMGSVSPSQLWRYNAYLGRYFTLWRWKLNSYLRYQFRGNVSRPTPSTDFRSHQLTTGANLRLTRSLSFNATEDWNFVDETTVNVQSRPRAFSAGLNYNFPIPRKIPLTANYGLNYRNEENTESARSFLSGEDTISHSLDLTYALTDETELFLNGALEQIRFEDGSQRQVEGNIFMGVRSSFNTPVRWNPRSSVVGIVFEDSNGNGYQDTGEKGIQGITVGTEEKRDVSDEEGYFLLYGVTGKTAFVSLDLSSVPSGYVITGLTEKEVEIVQGEPALVKFGILSIAQIRGFVYNDLDSNHAFDTNDVGIAHVTLWLDDQYSAETDRYGYFNFGRVEPGQHILRIDVEKLPYTYVTDVPLQQEITLKTNESYEHFFPMRTIRIISGKVFHDANQNGRYDSGEKGVQGVQLRTGKTTVTTDAQGNYLVEDIPVGTIITAVNEETLPSQYRLWGPKESSIEIRAEGTVAQDVNFPVIEK